MIPRRAFLARIASAAAAIALAPRLLGAKWEQPVAEKPERPFSMVVNPAYVDAEYEAEFFFVKGMQPDAIIRNITPDDAPRYTFVNGQFVEVPKYTP